MEALPTRQLDPFAALELPRAFELEEEELEKAHRQASLRWHPDRFALRPEPERLDAENRMAVLNESFEVLRDPLRRAEFLLSLEGHPMRDGSDTTSSPAFLMEMMELKEELSEAAQAGNADLLRSKHQELLCREWEEVDRIKTLFHELESTPAESEEKRHGVLHQIRSLLNQIAYQRKSREEIQQSLIHL